MKIYKAKDYVDMSRKAANIVSAQVIMKPNCVLGLATGSTPIGLYKQLVEWYNKGDLPFAKSGMGSLYMIAMCYVIEKNYCEAALRISNLLNILDD